MKIIAGIYKNTKIPSPNKLECRPSTGKIKEALFSILTAGSIIENDYIQGTNVLDMFAGTGALAFEALSRGASKITLIENNCKYFPFYKAFLTRINREKDARLIYLDIFKKNIQLQEQYDLIFIDPPYNMGLVNKSLDYLYDKNLLKEQAIIVIETAKQEFHEQQDYLLLNKHFQQIFYRDYSNNVILILSYHSLAVKNTI